MYSYSTPLTALSSSSSAVAAAVTSRVLVVVAVVVVMSVVVVVAVLLVAVVVRVIVRRRFHRGVLATATLSYLSLFTSEQKTSTAATLVTLLLLISR